MNIIAASQVDANSIGASVIRQEAQGLVDLAASLDANFSRAVNCIVATSGRVIVAGMGKSGLICRKIAATLSATGSAAFFLHPAEASHGDLGSLKVGDTLLVLSNSGATPELRPMVAYAQHIGVPVIAIASDARSDLMCQADIAILLPQVAEACPERIAPTTSTTMMLALGDALAIAAMRLRGTSREDLIRWHPGGNIGWQALEVDISGAETLSDAARLAGQALESLLASVPGHLPLAVRVSFTGQSPAHRALLGQAFQLRQEVIAQAVALDAERLWIEKVRIASQAPDDAPRRVPGDEVADALMELENLAKTAASEADFMNSLQQDIQTVLEKLPHDVRLAMPELNDLRQDPASQLPGLLAQSVPVLMARLLEGPLPLAGREP